MTHHTTATGRPFIECDDPIRADDGTVTRCGRRTYGRRDRLDPGPKLSLFDLPQGWSVAPFPDDCDHGRTRTSLIDGCPIPPLSWEVGLVGDLHTCPRCGGSRQ